MGFIVAKRTIGFKLESTPYTAETLTASDYNIGAYNVNYDPDIAMYVRKLAYGDFDRSTAIAGKRKMSISFTVDLCKGSTLATAPNYFKCLQACGCKQITWGSTGMSLVPHADYTNVPATIEIVEKDEGTSASQLVIKASGCMGNAKMVCNNVGEPVRLDFEFQGVYQSVTDRAFASLIVPTGFDTNLPPAVLLATGTPFTEAHKFNNLTIDLGNKVELWSDQSKGAGIEGAHIVDRDPVMEFDPDLALLATNNHYSRHVGNTQGAFSLQVGNDFTISSAKAQIMQSYKPGEREGHVMNKIRVQLSRNLGNDSLEILQGVK